jgi:ubiquinone/menaquinone biosynthesis C-methylase UbiE
MTDEAQPTETRGRMIRGWMARFYDAMSWVCSLGGEAKTNREIVERAEIKPGERVLDVGCGTGAQTLPAAETAGPGNVVGIDPSPDMLERAREKAAKKRLDIDFRNAAIEKLPFADQEFDAVLSSFMLHHLPEDVMRGGFGEIQRVLKPGGRLLAVDMISGRSLVGRIIGLFGHAHKPHALERIKSQLTGAGFSNVDELPSKQGHIFFLRAERRA